MQERSQYQDFQNLKKITKQSNNFLSKPFTLQMSQLLIIWKIDLKEGLIIWVIIQQEWSMSKNQKNFGSIVRIKIFKIKEEMKRKEK